ncbi:hypothetical protein D9M68_751860 [compost metagenome]
MRRQRLVARVPCQGQVELAQLQPLAQLAAARHAGLDAHLGMGAREAAEHGRQQRLAEVFLQAQPHPALQVDAAQGGAGLVVEFEHAVRVGQQRFAGIGERQAAALLAEQHGAGLRLQLLELRAHSRGRAAQLVGRARIAAERHAGGEGAQHVEIEHHLGHCGSLRRFFHRPEFQDDGRIIF